MIIGNDVLFDLGVSINSKGGYCWKYVVIDGKGKHCWKSQRPWKILLEKESMETAKAE